MGCFSGTLKGASKFPGPRDTASLYSDGGNRFGKPHKDYKKDPSFKAFVDAGAKGSSKSDPRSMYLTKPAQVQAALTAVSVECSAGGTHEFKLLDRDFNN